jgi:hypothetical protein
MQFMITMPQNLARQSKEKKAFLVVSMAPE